MTRSCANAKVHSEVLLSTLKTMRTGNALMRAGASTVRRYVPFPTRSGTTRLVDLPLAVAMNWITSGLPTTRELSNEKGVFQE
jgi:hypothetical protein